MASLIAIPAKGPHTKWDWSDAVILFLGFSYSEPDWCFWRGSSSLIDFGWTLLWRA